VKALCGQTEAASYIPSKDLSRSVIVNFAPASRLSILQRHILYYSQFLSSARSCSFAVSQVEALLLLVLDVHPATTTVTDSKRDH